VAGYSGTPLPRKLGIAAGSRVLLVKAPPGFDLGELPDGVTVHRRRRTEPYDVVLLFCADNATLIAGFAPLIPLVRTAGALWACWPKRASGVLTDVGERAVHEHGLSTGLVDVKVAAIDETWSGFKFVRRRGDRIS
jgi:hypothetical protein